MAITIDQLQIEIQARSTSAASSIDALSTSLGKLRTAVKGGAGLTTTTKQLQAFSQAVQSMQAPTQKIAALVAALKPLETIGKSNLGSALNQLKKIPDITAGLDDAKLSAFASKIQQVTVAVRPLAAEMEKVSLGFSKLPANIQRAINANARLTASNKKTAFGFNMLAAKITIVYMGLRRVANIIGGWIKESNDYVENLNLFTVAMGSGAEEAQRFAEHVGEALGIDPSEWMRNQGIFNTLLTGFGVVSDKAALMSKNLTQLGYDLGSFFNISFADAMQKLQSGISGELEPLRRLGYDLSQAKLEAIALSLGIDRSVSSMTQAEKAQLRYYAILTQVTTAQGDMARTLEAPANQLRVLQAQATQAARALGNIFIPALNAVLPYAIAFLKVIRMVADALASLFGFSLPEIDYSGVNGLASSGEDAADALGDAASSAKKLKGLLAGFDELNIIQQDASAAGAGGGVSGGDLGIDLPEYDFLAGLAESNVAAIFEKWKAKIEPILTWIKNNFDIIKGMAIGIGIALLGWKLSGGLTGGISTLLANLKSISAFLLGLVGAAALVGGAFDAWVNGVDWQNLLFMIGGTAAIVAGLAIKFGGVGAAVGLLVGGIVALVVGLKDWITTGELSTKTFVALEFGILAVGGALAILISPWALVVAAVAAAALAIYKYWDEIKSFFSNTWAAIRNGIETAWNGIKNFFTTTIPKIVSDIVGWFKELPGKIAYEIGFIVGKLTAWKDNTVKWVKEKVPEIITRVVTFFAELPGKIKEKLDAFKDTIVTWKNNAIKWFKEELPSVINNVIDWFAKLPDALVSVGKNMIYGLWNGIMSVGDWLWTKIKSFFGGIWDIVSDVFKGFGSGLEAGYASVPKYAMGGYPASGQMFIAREAGPEMVGTMGGRTTVANNGQIEAGIEEAAYRGFMRALAQSSSNGGETTVVMQVGETELGRVAIRGINRAQRQAGVSLVSG